MSRDNNYVLRRNMWDRGRGETYHAVEEEI